MPTEEPSAPAFTAPSGVRSAPRATGWWRRLRFITWKTVRSLLMLDDTPQRIARGCAAGLLVAMLPILGQMFFALLAARLMRGNLLAALTACWISNPLTAVPLWYGGYRLGHALLPSGKPPLSYDDLAVIVTAFGKLSLMDGVGALLRLLGDIMPPLLLGTVLMGLFCAVTCWLVLPPMVAWMQRRKAERRQRWLTPLR